MSTSHDVIVVGLGAMGSAACWRLAKRGVRVLGLEQFDIPHARGSSHGHTRMTRTAYHEHPDYVPLLRRANELWREIEAEKGVNVLHLTGGLYMGKPDGEVVSGALLAARRHGLAIQSLDRAELSRRFPQFHLPDDHVGVLEEQAGYLQPELAISAFAVAAMRLGAELHGHEPVLEWSDEGSHVLVKTPRGEYSAERILFCGGPWSGKLLGELDLKLTVTRQALAWVWPRRPELFGHDRLPVWAVGRDDGGLHYGFPMRVDSAGFKIALHAPADETDPDRVNREPTPADEATVRPFLQTTMPDADGPLLAIRICLYTNSPDHHFIIDRHPAHERVVLACGFSGHGFKFASVIGEVLADLATGGATHLPIQFLGLSRFEKK